MIITDALGWIGLTLLLLAHYLLSIEKIKDHSYTYHLLNLVGAFSIVIHAYMIKSYPIMILNLFWGIISIGEILQITKNR